MRRTSLSLVLAASLSNALTLPARFDETSVDSDIDSSGPARGLSGLANTEHSSSFRRGSDLYANALKYTALCDTTLCRRRKSGTLPESPIDSDADGVSPSGSSSSPPASSASSASSGSSSNSSFPSTSSSAPISIPSSPTSSFPSTSSSAPLPTPATSRDPDSRRDTVGIIVGTVLGVVSLAIAILSFFFYHRFRRRMSAFEAHAHKPSPSYTVSSSEPTRPPSMRERNDRFSDTHTPAGTPLTRSPGVSFLTSISSHSMGLAHLSSLSGSGVEKGAHRPSSPLGTSTEGDEFEAPLENPPPEYESHQ